GIGGVFCRGKRDRGRLCKNEGRIGRNLYRADGKSGRNPFRPENIQSDPRRGGTTQNWSESIGELCGLAVQWRTVRYQYRRDRPKVQPNESRKKGTGRIRPLSHGLQS